MCVQTSPKVIGIHAPGPGLSNDLYRIMYDLLGVQGGSNVDGGSLGRS